MASSGSIKTEICKQLSSSKRCLSLTPMILRHQYSAMFKYLFLPTDTAVLIPKELTKFKCLILIEREVGDRYRNDVSDVLVEAGCLYSMAWGIDCTLWDDSVDWACNRFFDGGIPPEDKFVMTTWHDDETLQETVQFAKHCTKYSDVKLDDILVLDFSTQEREAFIEKLYQ